MIGFLCGVCLGLAIEESTAVQEKIGSTVSSWFQVLCKLDTDLDHIRLDLIAFCTHNLDSLEYPVIHSFFVTNC